MILRPHNNDNKTTLKDEKRDENEQKQSIQT